jgi:hypothetical protein
MHVVNRCTTPVRSPYFRAERNFTSMTIHLRCALNTRRHRIFIFSTSNHKWYEMITYASFYRAVIRDNQRLQLHFREQCCMELRRPEAWSMFKYLVVLTSRHITMKFKNMNSKGKFVFSQCSYSHTVIISVLVFGAFAQSRKAPLCFVCVVFSLFQVLLTCCASPWRAGETTNGASPKYCHYYVTKLSAVS